MIVEKFPVYYCIQCGFEIKIDGFIPYTGDIPDISGIICPECSHKVFRFRYNSIVLEEKEEE